MSPEAKNALNTFFESAITILLPLLLTFLSALASLAMLELRRYLAAKVGKEHADLAGKLLDMIVVGIEQEYRKASNPERFVYAMSRAQDALSKRGIEVDDRLLTTWIESAYKRYKDSNQTFAFASLEGLPLKE